MIANVFRAFLSEKLNAGGTETIISVDRITTLTGETITTSDFADFSRGVLTINPDGDGEESYPEFVSFTAISGLTFTGAVRGLSARSNAVVAANIRFHPVDTPVIISFGGHLIQDVIDYVTAAIATATIGTNVALAATAGENVTQGNIVYLKNDGKWWKADADLTATIDSIELGITQSTALANATITNGVMRLGLDTHQSGLVAGTEYYVSNTAGAISTSAGTLSRKVGVARSTTNLYFDANYGLLPSSSQKAALDAATAPTATNPFKTTNKPLTAGATIAGTTLPVPVYQDTSSFKYLPCISNDTTKIKFQGFATSTSTDTNPINIQFDGVVPGFTGLTRGVKYYLQDVSGTIGTTPGTYEVYVGIAVSTTELLIMKGPQYANGTTTFAATGTTVITLGFRPSRVRIHGICATGSTVPSPESHGGWAVNGGNNCVYLAINTSNVMNGAATANAWYVSTNTTSGQQSGIVTTITDTGFTLSNTKVGTVGNVSLFWEAEGEF